MTHPVSQQELDTMGCSNPNCKGHDDSILFIHPNCHEAPVFIHYDKRTGHLVVECAVCDNEVLRIDVKEMLPTP
jgi:hypothetical protein